MAIARFNAVRRIAYSLGSSRSYSNVIANDSKCWRYSSSLYKEYETDPRNNKFAQIMCREVSSYICKDSNGFPWTSGDQNVLRSTSGYELSNTGDVRLFNTKAKAPAQAQLTGSLKVSMLSPGIIYEPYAPREQMPFWKRWFTKYGWSRTKDDILLELRSAYAIGKLRKTGYSKQKFYKEAVELYKQINSQIANGDKGSLRKTVTENMYSALKNEIKQREKRWSKVHWELVEPIVKIRTLRARLISVDKDDLTKVFIQLTLEFLSKQKFEAYDYNGATVSGDKNKEVLVRDIWVFEKSLFHTGAYWRLCGRINPKLQQSSTKV